MNRSVQHHLQTQISLPPAYFSYLKSFFPCEEGILTITNKHPIGKLIISQIEILDAPRKRDYKYLRTIQFTRIHEIGSPTEQRFLYISTLANVQIESFINSYLKLELLEWCSYIGYKGLKQIDVFRAFIARCGSDCELTVEMLKKIKQRNQSKRDSEILKFLEKHKNQKYFSPNCP